MVRICLFGLTGSGKSTLARLCVNAITKADRSGAVLKLAEPLYRLQREFYAVAARPIDPYRQDQLLLESIATHLRRISPTSLADDFRRRLALLDVDVVINEDLRDPYIDYPALRELGFTFIRVQVDEEVRRKRLANRLDLSTVTDSATTRGLDLITPDLVLDNSGDDLGQLTSTILPAILDLR